MSTDKCADVLCIIASDLAVIIADEELMSELGKTTNNRDGAIKTGIQIVSKIVPKLLNQYKENTFNILGAVNDKTAKEIGEQLLPVTLSQITEVIRDKELISFFSSSIQ